MKKVSVKLGSGGDYLEACRAIQSLLECEEPVTVVVEDLTATAIDLTHCSCGNKHPLVAEFGRCGKCMESVI